MTRRDYIPWREKCAALICLHFDIPYEHALAMHVDQVNGLVEFDHWPIPKAIGGPDRFFNLTPRLKADHKEKTAKVDIPEIAKSKRVSAKWAEHKQTLEHKAGRAEKPEPKRNKRKVPSRPMPKMPDGFKKNWRTGRVERVQP